MAVLCVGIVCLDIVNYCDRYPQEDDDIRATDQKWRKGGNAANTASVLRLLGREDCGLLSTLGSGMETDYIISELDQLGIDHTHCIIHPDHRLPTSYVLLNTTNGSRTIVHYKTLPELTFGAIKEIDLTQYKWIHFEGRNVNEVIKMISHIRERTDGPTISIELEKVKPELAQLIGLADVLFVSKEYAGYHGYKSAKEACLKFREKTKENSVVICGWGDKGAAGTDSSGQAFTSPVFPPAGGLVDTLGAGDTFNAAVIHKMLGRANVQEAITYGCKVAGAKCGMNGFDELKFCNNNLQ